MHYHYLQEKDYRMKQMVWEMMEQLQEKYPYYEFGWWGFSRMIILRENA